MEKPQAWFWWHYCDFRISPCLKVPHSIWGSYPTRLGAAGLHWRICQFLEGMIRDSQPAGDNVRFCLKDETKHVLLSLSLSLSPAPFLSLPLSAGRSEIGMDRWVMNFSKENTDWTSPSVKLASNQFVNLAASSEQMLKSDFKMDFRLLHLMDIKWYPYTKCLSDSIITGLRHMTLRRFWVDGLTVRAPKMCGQSISDAPWRQVAVGKMKPLLPALFLKDAEAKSKTSSSWHLHVIAS